MYDRTERKLGAIPEKSQKHSVCVSRARVRPGQSRTEQCQIVAGEGVLSGAVELGQNESKTGSEQARAEPRHIMGTAQAHFLGQS